MKIITLDKIKEYIENIYGSQQISIVNIVNCTSNKNRIVIIHDSCSNCVKPTLNTSFDIVLRGDKKDIDSVRCTILEEDILDLDEKVPFMELKHAVSGKLKVCGTELTADELWHYTYII